MNIKKACKGALAAAILVLAAVILGAGLMTCVYMLPTGRMLTNIDHSFETIDTEGSSFTWAPGYVGSRLDEFTDNIMLQTAVFSGDQSAPREAMLNRRMEFPKAGLNPGDALINYVYGARNGEISSYGRYWHGYLLFLKPLLLFFTLSDIRMFLMIAQWSLAAMLLLAVYQKKGMGLAVPLGLTILCLNPVSTAMSMQYSSIYLLTLLFALAELKLDSFSKSQGWILYLALGICTAFFDFLTYPPAAFGVCVVLEILLSQSDRKLEKTIFSGLSWGFGYGGMWAGKWLIGSLLTGQNILADALATAQQRTGTEVSAAEGARSADFLAVLSRNLGVYASAAYGLLFCAALALFFFLLLTKRRRFAPERGTLLPLCLAAVIPFAWYFFLKNHSFVHYWMTHRNLSITILAAAGFLGCSLRQNGGTEHG